MTLTVRRLAEHLAERFPDERAEPWDVNGLLVGDPEAEVTGVRLALDPSVRLVSRASAAGQNVVVTHHPAALSMPARLTAGPGPGGVLYAAAAAGVALVNAHTTLDRDARGQQRLPEILGLSPREPLESGLARVAVVTTYVPSSAAGRVRRAMSATGAGRIGDYRECSFSAAGTGRFTAPTDGRPALGRPGSSEEASEERIEMVCAPRLAPAVVDACTRAHPYEEPLVTVAEADIARNAARLGMLCSAVAGETLSSLAQRCAEVFSARPRVWGDPETPVRRVATTTGSGGSLLGDARRKGADVLVAGEVRYHDATAAGLAVIELGHDVSEWPLVDVLAEAVLGAPGIDESCVVIEPASAGWWIP